MFTGIVEEVGRLVAVERDDHSARLTVACARAVDGTEVGDSIAVNGCCVTVTSLVDGPESGFTADLMAETLRVTALGDLDEGDDVNLERALRAGDRLGGHLVQGHVDGVGEILGLGADGRDGDDPQAAAGTVWLHVRVPVPLARYLVAKGSVTVDGASLTVVDLPEEDTFRVGLIPHTMATTTFHARGAGDRVNLEVDVIARYVERLLDSGTASPHRS